MLQRIRFKYQFTDNLFGDRELNTRSETLSYEISTVVQNAIKEGRSHLNDEEAIYLLRMSEKLVKEYVDKLEKMSDI